MGYIFHIPSNNTSSSYSCSKKKINRSCSYNFFFWNTRPALMNLPILPSIDCFGLFLTLGVTHDFLIFDLSLCVDY